ncbi:hypothetical protein ADUPG1_012556 [Aduncisulcus paluster]|uniref:Uncharacterized protein n=1 Tax=Aduncisulcus paluster TaxID=2918883 RepID=A0ABQ5K1N0_9EUKA|nr:hypothetical protein ADUPG1_012556 [Aduncisulcus paluster]
MDFTKTATHDLLLGIFPEYSTLTTNEQRMDFYLEELDPKTRYVICSLASIKKGVGPNSFVLADEKLVPFLQDCFYSENNVECHKAQLSGKYVTLEDLATLDYTISLEKYLAIIQKIEARKLSLEEKAIFFQKKREEELKDKKEISEKEKAHDEGEKPVEECEEGEKSTSSTSKPKSIQSAGDIASLLLPSLAKKVSALPSAEERKVVHAIDISEAQLGFFSLFASKDAFKRLMFKRTSIRFTLSASCLSPSSKAAFAWKRQQDVPSPWDCGLKNIKGEYIDIPVMQHAVIQGIRHFLTERASRKLKTYIWACLPTYSAIDKTCASGSCDIFGGCDDTDCSSCSSGAGECCGDHKCEGGCCSGKDKERRMPFREFLVGVPQELHSVVTPLVERAYALFNVMEYRLLSRIDAMLSSEDINLAPAYRFIGDIDSDWFELCDGLGPSPVKSGLGTKEEGEKEEEDNVTISLSFLPDEEKYVKGRMAPFSSDVFDDEYGMYEYILVNSLDEIAGIKLGTLGQWVNELPVEDISSITKVSRLLVSDEEHAEAEKEEAEKEEAEKEEAEKEEAEKKEESTKSEPKILSLSQLLDMTYKMVKDDVKDIMEKSGVENLLKITRGGGFVKF